MIAPFAESMLYLLPQLGIQEVRKGKLSVIDQIEQTMDVMAVINLSRQLRGTIAYGMSAETACNFASSMMMGMPVPSLDSMAQSAIAEMVNMITAHAAMDLEKAGLLVDISPPSLILGDAKPCPVYDNRAIVIEMLTAAGRVEINVGLE